MGSLLNYLDMADEQLDELIANTHERMRQALFNGDSGGVQYERQSVEQHALERARRRVVKVATLVTFIIDELLPARPDVDELPEMSPLGAAIAAQALTMPEWEQIAFEAKVGMPDNIERRMIVDVLRGARVSTNTERRQR